MAIVCALAFLLIGAACVAADATEDIPLTSLDLGKVRQGWGEPQIDKAVTGVPLSIRGRKFDRGLGTHAESRIYVDLQGGAEQFVAWVGVDDKAGAGKGTVVFRIIGDGKTLYRSPVMKAGDAPRPVDVSLHGVRLLLLIASDAGDGINFDHADWADARFIGAKAKLVTVTGPTEEAIILTPKPSPKPRINGARVFGVRPGHPVLFTIAATGDRPMTFAAVGLPEGLSLDRETGRISGSLAKRGTYVMTLSAKNALGTANRDMRIVVGDQIALTPPMGWNDWYTFTSSITDKDVRAAADAMVSTGMINHGYSYVNIDDCWMVKLDSDDPEIGGPTRDAQGNILPNKRFPDMKALTDYIHSKGLKAGLYISPGPLTCGRYEGSYGHEAQDAKQFADWGFDFLKYDLCSYSRVWKGNTLEEQKRPYILMGYLLKKQDRDIVFNLCQYGNANVWEWGEEVGGNSWRTAGDIGSNPARYVAGFEQNGLEKWAGPGHWNDPDYINIGCLGSPTLLTPNEQYTYVTLWSLLAAPMFFSGDMTKLDDFTLSLLTNDEVIEVNQDPLGKQAYRVAQRGDTEVWAKDMEDGSKAVGLFNRGEMQSKVTVKWSDLGIDGTQRVRDLWRQRDVGVLSSSFATQVPRHGAVMLRLWDAQ
jgi:alpha-galactosidase